AAASRSTSSWSTSTRRRSSQRWARSTACSRCVGASDGDAVLAQRAQGARAIAKLVGELEGVDDRRARYVSELVAVTPEGEELRGTGTVTGRISHEPRGSEGFGYDPIFVPDGEERTVAELGDAWKAENSHRARAARAL